MKHTLSHIAVAIGLLLLPLQTLAAASVQVADTIAGLGATVSLSGFPAQADLTLKVSSPESDFTVPVGTDNKGNAMAALKSSQTESAGTYSVTVAQGSQALGSSTFDVMPDTVDSSASDLRTLQKSIDADGQDSATVIVTLRDQYGNVLSGRPVTLVSSRTSDVIENTDQETNAKGQQTFTVTATKEGVIALRALDLLSGTALLSSVTITAGFSAAAGGQDTVSASRKGNPYAAQITTFDVIDRFEITAPRTMVVGEEASKISIRAIDKSGNTVQDYTGTVRFDAPDDPDAVLPALGRYTFKDSDLGEKTFPITLKFQTTGDQTLRVEDEQDPTIYGEVNITVTGGDGHPAASQQITITSPIDGGTVSANNVVLQGTGPKLANLVVTGGAANITGDTDATGKFSIPVALGSGTTSVTLTVKDDSGRYSSAPLHLTVDTVAPEIKKVTFNPAAPLTNDQVLVIVESETKLGKITVSLPDGPESDLAEVSATPGTYQGFLMSPAQPGSYQPVVHAVDSAGNATDVRVMLTVGKPGLAKVTDLQAETKANSVSLQWDQVPGGVDGYRVYVGESATDFLYTLDTGRDVSKATVAGLSPGKVYFFAVTALKADEESAEKSDVIQARVLGLILHITPQDASLMAEWPDLNTQLPLSSYVLEYGVEENNYTEKRLINGDLKTYTIRDLLNGVAYFVRLTPVTITGDQLTDLQASGQGTPNGSGFHAGPGDPIPFDPTHPPLTHKPVLLDQTGVPGFVWWLTVSFALACATGAWYRHRTLRHSAAFLKAVQLNYRV